jgi:[ribosomal protein S5]-alanine N-acetyltransferase
MIEGELVNLRAREMSDLERNHRWMNDREVTRYLSMRYPISLMAEEVWMREGAAQPMAFGTGVFFAIDTKDGTQIGNINFHETSAEQRKARLGVVIGEKAHWSKGYGTDAMRTFLRFAFDEMNLHRVDLTVDADNGRAIACYRKCGFVEEVRMRQARFVRGAFCDQFVMGILRDEFHALHGVRGGAAEVAR